MSNVDDRIVSMTFDNENFESRIGTTLDSLDRLAQSLQFVGAQDGFTAVANAADSVDLGAMADQVDNISGKFTAMGAVAFSVINNITNSILEMAKTAPTDFLEKVLGGGKERALNLEQAKFLFAGIGADVETSMANAKQAVLGTAFGLDEAAKAAAQLEASGTKAGDELTGQLRGIAGVAAMTNSSFAEISDVFTQAAGQGKVSGYTLERISQRGLNVASVMAKQMGITEAEVRQMASDGKIDFQTFAKAMDDAFGAHATEANKTYTGSLSNMHAAMSRLGAEFQTPRLVQQRDLFNALTPVIDKVHDALTPLITTFVNLRRLSIDHLIEGLGNLNLDTLKFSIPAVSQGITNIYEALHQILKAGHDAFRDIFPKSSISVIAVIASAFEKLSEKIKMGDGTIERLKFVFDGLFSVLRVLLIVVRDVINVIHFWVTAMFPATDGITNLIVHVSRLVQWFATMFIFSGKLDWFFLHFADIVRHPTHLIDALRDSFEHLINFVISHFSKATSTVETHVSGMNTGIGHASDTLTLFQKLMEGFLKIPDLLGAAWDRLADRWKPVIKVLEGVAGIIGLALQGIGGAIKDAFSGPGAFDQALDAVNVGLLGGLVILIKKFIDGGALNLLTGGIWEKINGMFDQLSDTLKTFQDKVKFDGLMKIAEAVGILTVSLVVLSLINPEALSKALIAMGAAFGELIGTMKLLDSIGGGGKSSGAKVASLAVAMDIVAASMVILAGAIVILGNMDPVGLTRGLIGLTVGLTAIVGAVSVLAGLEGGTIAAAISLNLIATSMVVLSAAVLAFGHMDWGAMGKGLLGIAGALLIVTAAMDGAETSLPGAIAVGIIAVALNVLFVAVKAFSTLDWGQLAKGLVGVLGVLLIVSAALEGMQGGILGAAALFIVAPALVVLAEAVKIFGDMDLGEIGKGLLALFGSLLILNAALIGMAEAIPGAVALVIVSGALTVLVEVIKALGQMDLSTILTGLGALVAVLAVLGISAAVMQPIIPALLGLGVALTLVGGAVALFGVGIYLLGLGFETLAGSGVAGIQALIDGLKLLVGAIPELLKAVFASILSFADDFLNSMPLFIKLLSGALEALLDAVIKLAPKFGQAILELLDQFYLVALSYEPKIIALGIGLILALLKGIRDNIGEITQVVVEIISNFLIALGQNAPTLVEGIHTFLLDVMKAVAYEIGQSDTDFIPVGLALIHGFIDGLTAGIGLIWDAIGGVVDAIIGAFKSMLGISSPSTVFFDLAGDVIMGFLNGLVLAAEGLFFFFVQLPLQILEWLGQLELTLVQKGIDLLTGLFNGILSGALAIAGWLIGLPGTLLGLVPDLLGTLKDKGIDILKGLLKGIEEGFKDVAGWFLGLPAKIIGSIPNPLTMLSDIGGDIIDGLSGGISGSVGSLGDAVKQVVGTIPDDARNKLASRSPSRVMMAIGVDVVKGLINGINSMAGDVGNSTTSLAEGIVNKFNLDPMSSALANAADQIGQLDDFHPVITPVLDLSQVQQDSAGISKMMADAKISANLSADQANIISAGLAAQGANETQPATTSIEQNYNQTINSPKPLSTADIYKQSKSQMALMKEELNI